ncbi:MAG: hypothetical protein OXP09_21840 [Gammaproteobacteria bacterium]|nr:hypothetical protein [Gammaproteobacteria bacterium]
MASDESGGHWGDRPSPHARVPLPFTAGFALQLASLVLPGAVLIPTVVFRAAGQPEDVLLWAVFASIAVCGASTLLQALRVGRFGAGYILATGASGASIAVSIAALAAGGPALLAALVICLGLFQIALSARLSLFRSIFTPTVTGTVMMLTPVTVMPIIFEQLQNVPAATPPAAAPLSALITLLVIAGLILKAGRSLRLWAPVIGIVAGSAVAAAYGLYDFDRVARSAWIGLPGPEWPITGADFGLSFWALLPGFLFIAVVCTIQTISCSVAIQRVSWAESRAVDFRAVQGAVAADGVGNLMSGLAGTMPAGSRPNGASMVEITGISTRRIGVGLGAVMIALACFPKALAVILAIPGPVTAAFIGVTMATIFVIGLRIIVQGGIDTRQGLIAGVSFWTGAGFQSGVIFPELVSPIAGGVLNNGMIAGGILAIVMTLFVQLTKPRPQRIDLAFDLTALQTIREFLGAFAARSGWNAAMRDRLGAASEETLLTLLHRDESAGAAESRRLLLVARAEDGGATLEFVASKGEENLQDRIALLDDIGAETKVEQEVSLRLLRHLASSIRHQQYHGTDIVTLRVELPHAEPT